MERPRTIKEVADAVNDDSQVGEAIRLWVRNRLRTPYKEEADAMLLATLEVNLHHYNDTPLEFEMDEHETHPGAA